MNIIPFKSENAMNNFSINTRENGNVQILDLKGYLDAHTTPDLEKALQTLVEKQKFNILVNCKELTYISSAGLGVFMAYIEDVRKHKGILS
jgi:anti-sigma B factor antagonist